VQWHARCNRHRGPTARRTETLKRLLRRGWPSAGSAAAVGERERWVELAAAYRPHLPNVTLQVGDLIADDYRVESILGTTGLTVTYLVRSTSQRARMVVKTLRSAYLRDPSAQKAFRRAARAWLRLGSHPYLVRAHALAEVRPRQYLVVEHVAPGQRGPGSLQSHLERRRPDLAQGLRWAIEVCHGMEHAVASGLRFHGDLKPTNILIGADRTARVTDPGLAEVLGVARAAPPVTLSVHGGQVRLSRQTVDRVGYGTPTHMPPEQFTDADRCDQRSDIYSLGIVLYQIATGGRLPFWAPLPDRGVESQAERLRQEMDYWREMRRLHATALVPPVDGRLDPILAACLAKSPADRYRTFAELRVDLERRLADLAPDAPVPDPRRREAARELYREAIGFVRQSRLAEATDLLEEALRVDPSHALGWVDRGACLRQQGRFADALTALDRAIALDPDRADAWDERGLSLRSLGRLDEAAASLDQAVARDPESAPARHHRGIVCQDAGRHGDAIGWFDRALDLDPRLAAAWFNRATSLSHLKRLAEAAESYERALRLTPDDAPTSFYLAATLQRLGRHAEADSHLDRALALEPQMVEAWNNKGVSRRERGRPDEALACFDRALAIDPDSAQARANRAMALADLGRHAEAVAAFDDAIAREPELALAWLGKGLCLVAVGRHEEALRCYDRAIEVEPWLGLTWNARGLALNALGRLEEAIASFDVALGIDSRFGVVWNNRGLSLRLLGRDLDAADSFDQAVGADPHLAVGWTNRGLALRRLGRCPEALAALRRATELDPAAAEAWLERAELAEQVGHHEEATEARRRHRALADRPGGEAAEPLDRP
jgi:tetratricopeptide (TPR) repeat protein